MYEEGSKEYMFLAGTKRILGGYRRASFFHAVICFFYVHTYLCFWYTLLAYALFSSSCEAIRTGYHSWSASLYYVVYVFEIFLCLLLSFFVVDFLCRFNLLNCEYCVKAFLKRLSIYFPYPSDLVVIIPHKLSGLPFTRSEVLDRP